MNEKNKVLGTSANWSASLQICKLRTQGLTCGFSLKKLKSTGNPQSNDIAGMFLGYLQRKMQFYGSMYRRNWVDAFIMYNNPLSSLTVVEQLFSKGAFY